MRAGPAGGAPQVRRGDEEGQGVLGVGVRAVAAQGGRHVPPYAGGGRGRLQGCAEKALGYVIKAVVDEAAIAVGRGGAVIGTLVGG